MRQIGNNIVSPTTEGNRNATCLLDFVEIAKHLGPNPPDKPLSAEVVDQAVIDASYCIDAPGWIPIGGVIISGGPGDTGHFKPGAYLMSDKNDQCVWMSGRAFWTQPRL